MQSNIEYGFYDDEIKKEKGKKSEGKHQLNLSRLEAHKQEGSVLKSPFKSLDLYHTSFGAEYS